MSYEKELAELWKDWKNSTDKYEQAIENGYDVDADMWANDVEAIHRQIHIHEQAAKADEYEAKAKAFDNAAEKLHARIDHILMTSHPAQQKPGYVDGLYNALDIINSELKSGEPK